MRVGAVTGPLDAMYHGPYRVMVRERKKLLLEVGATRQWVSIDRLKPHTVAAAPAAAASTWPSPQVLMYNKDY